MNPLVSVIILNWNGWEDTVECLESLYQINYPNYDVVLVDNDSSDDSIERIRDYCEAKIKPESNFYTYQSGNKPIKIFQYTKEETELEPENEKLEGYSDIPSKDRLFLIENDKNYGFAEGNNIGIRYALKTLHPDYVLLLNNDTVVEPNFLSELLKTGESNDKIAVVGPKTYFYDYNGRNDVVWSVGGTVDLSRYPGYHNIDMDDNHPPVDNHSIMEVDWISGAVMLIKTDRLSSSFLNSDFFFGCEDVDLCIEMEKKDLRMVTNLNSVVWHKASVSKNKVRFRGLSREIKTNLKFMKTHEKNYRLHLPIYILQINTRIHPCSLKK